jgi:hypothetical protein
MTVTEVMEADSNPVQFFYPYLRRMLSSCASGLDKYMERRRSAQRWAIKNVDYGRPFQGSKETELRKLVGLLLSAQHQSSELVSCLTNVKMFRKSKNEAHGMIADLEELIARAAVIQDSYRQEIQLVGDMLSREVSNLAILESQKSIEQAVSVKRKSYSSVIPRQR